MRALSHLIFSIRANLYLCKSLSLKLTHRRIHNTLFLCIVYELTSPDGIVTQEVVGFLLVPNGDAYIVVRLP